jgi:hypothetical protein
VAVSDGPFIAEFEDRLFEADFHPEWEVTAPLSVGPLDYLAELLATAGA